MEQSLLVATIDTIPDSATSHKTSMLEVPFPDIIVPFSTSHSYETIDSSIYSYKCVSSGCTKTSPKID